MSTNESLSVTFFSLWIGDFRLTMGKKENEGLD